MPMDRPPVRFTKLILGIERFRGAGATLQSYGCGFPPMSMIGFYDLINAVESETIGAKNPLLIFLRKRVQ